VFELKTRGDDYVPERPKDGPLPKYWNNSPKDDDVKANAFHEMAQMKQECKKHKEKVKQEQVMDATKDLRPSFLKQTPVPEPKLARLRSM
jgi:hypothetical protein